MIDLRSVRCEHCGRPHPSEKPDGTLACWWCGNPVQRPPEPIGLPAPVASNAVADVIRWVHDYYGNTIRVGDAVELLGSTGTHTGIRGVVVNEVSSTQVEVWIQKTGTFLFTGPALAKVGP